MGFGSHTIVLLFWGMFHASFAKQACLILWLSKPAFLSDHYLMVSESPLKFPLYRSQPCNGISKLTSWLSWRRQWHPTPILLPGKSHRWRSLVGCSPRGRWELDTTEWLHFHFSLSCTGEGNGNPLQCSSLENPRDGRAWWAAVYGVAQSRTRLKWLSSSSSSSWRLSGKESACSARDTG